MDSLRPSQHRAAALTLAEAFEADPLLQILAPDPPRRAKLGPAMMAVLLAYGLRYGRVWANDDASAVAIWLHPESGPMTMPRMLRAGFWRAPSMLGFDGLGRMSKAMAATEGFHKQVHGPHWYLMTVGTRTDRQGQGLGSQLVELGTDRADERRGQYSREHERERGVWVGAHDGFLGGSSGARFASERDAVRAAPRG